MANLKDLQARLAASLDNANKREAKAAPKLPTAAKPKTARTAPKPRTSKGAKYARLSISLFPTDLDRLNAIRSYLGARGHQITTSQAIKVALRTSRLSEDLTEALRAIKAEDGRGR